MQRGQDQIGRFVARVAGAVAEEQPGMVETAARFGAQGATGGLADEIYGGVRAFADDIGKAFSSGDKKPEVKRDEFGRITNLDEIEEYTEQFSVSGGYGTDFRPVFSYVEKLRNSGELKNLKGLMYFTDGYGEYPKKPTDYQTVFVFYGDDTPQKTFSGEPIKVPDWAVKLYLSEDTKG